MSDNYLQYWYDGLAADVGIVVSTNDRERFRAKMYQARREACDLSLDRLSLVFSPTSSNEVWVIHNDQKERGGTPDEGDAEPLLK